MASSVKPYVQTIYNRPTLTTQSEGLLHKEETMKKNTMDKNLIKRGKTWTCIYYVYDPIKGKKVPRWKGGFKTKKEARDARVKLQAEADEHDMYLTRMTFSRYADTYLQTHEAHLRPASLRYYNRVLRYCEPIDDIPIDDILGEDIEKIHMAMKASGKLSPQTIYRYLSQIKVFFNFAEKRGEIKVNPFNRFVMPPNKPVKHYAPSNETIIEMIQKSEGMIIHLPILLAVMLGLRRGEVFGLQYDDFDFENSTVSIQRQVTNCSVDKTDYRPAELKTESSFRTLKVPKSLLNIIEKRREENPQNSFVFAKPDGELYTPVYVMRMYKEFCDENGYKVRFHDLRHAYGTICLNAKIPMKAISDTLGHKDIAVTSNIYCDTRELLDAPADLMEERFGAILNQN